MTRACSVLGSLATCRASHLSRNFLRRRTNLTMIHAAALILLQLLPASALIESYCNADGSTSVASQGDFRYNSIVFGPKFKPQCSCANYTLHCQNECETCFRGVCGVMETSQKEGPEDSVVSNYSLCMTFTAGRAPIGGTTCFRYDQASAGNVTDPDGSKTCDMTYNGESCTWCRMHENGCVRANCTNILQDARVNTCWTAYQGIGQQFRLAALVNNITSIQQTQIGSCGYGDLDSYKLWGNEALQSGPPKQNDTESLTDRDQGEGEIMGSDTNQEGSMGHLFRWSQLCWTLGGFILAFLL